MSKSNNVIKKKIMLVRNEETFLVNAIKNALLSNRFEVVDSTYTLSDLAVKKNDADLIVLYTDQDFEEHKDAMVYFKDLCIEENMIMLIIGDKDAFDLVHKFVPKEDIAFEVTRPLDMADLINKIATATDEEFEQRCKNYDHARPFTKESLLYREIFEKYYPDQSQMIVDFWMPNKAWEGCDVNDPSARVLSNYGDSGK